jgi:CRP-like cAMP-binding protein
VSWDGIPLYRPGLYERLRRGDGLILAAMSDETVLFQAGEQLVEAGRPQGRVYRLRTGWASRTRTLADGRRQTLGILLPGDLFGVRSLVLARAAESIEALSPVTLNWCPRDRLLGLADAQPDVALRLMQHLAEVDRRLEQWAVTIARCSAEERLAALFLQLRARLRQIGLMPRNSFVLPMTQQQIGDCLALTVVHVNRVLRRFRDAGLLTVRDRVVTFGDVEGLVRLAAACSEAGASGDASAATIAEGLIDAPPPALPPSVLIP